MTTLPAAVSVVNLGILITAAATLVAAIGGIVVGLVASGRADQAHATAAEVRIMVNGRIDALLTRTQQLEQHIVTAGLPLPPDPSVGTTGG